MWDCSGWATKNNIRCTDGRVIRKNAFRVNDKERVPLVWNHQHNSPDKVLGHAMLENREEGVYAYCYFNNTENGKNAKEQVQHGDVTALSIWANNLQQDGRDVLHGVIKEVSLVLAGANPGAYIESVMAHGEPMDDYDVEGIFYHDDSGIVLAHAEESKKEEPENKEGDKKEGEKTVKQVLSTFDDDQKKVLAILVTQAIKDAKAENKSGEEKKEEEDKELKHNVFDNEKKGNILSHSDIEKIFDDARALGSMKKAIQNNIEDGGVLAHALDTTGLETPKGKQNYGFKDADMLFPDYKSVTNTPEWISRNMDWVKKVMAEIHHTPFSRIKSTYANITEDEARARGYIKGKQKKTEVFSILKRVTSATTIYKLQKMDRDDIVDITDFDVIAWIKAEMRVMLEEEIARAILIGDGRLADDESHIPEQNIRPVAKDVPLFNTKVLVDIASEDDPNSIADKTIDTIIRARKNYKGSGNPTFFTTEDVLTEMLMLKDKIGHKLYKTEAELATALRVKEIVTIELMAGQKIDHNGTELPLIGVIVNLADYNVGADKGGEVNLFDDFDLDFNKYEYLIETRISGALVKPFSALTILENRGSIAG